MQGENCNKLKVFLWGPWKGIVSATPAQVNNLIEYCIKMIIWYGYRANNCNEHKIITWSNHHSKQ